MRKKIIKGLSTKTSHWVASIVDLRVFWQPGSVLSVLNCRDYFLFASNKFLLFLLRHKPGL